MATPAPLRRQPAGDGEADAARGARDGEDALREIELHRRPQRISRGTSPVRPAAASRMKKRLAKGKRSTRPEADIAGEAQRVRSRSRTAG